jgi:hypothetical protein
MTRRSVLFTFLFFHLFISINCQSDSGRGKSTGIESDKTTKTVDDSGALDLRGVDSMAHPFVVAYPEFIDSVSGNTIYWKDGTKMPLQTSKAKLDDISNIESKEYEELLNNADPLSMLSPDYPLLQGFYVPQKYEDPGRFRNSEFLKKVYGKNSGEVSRNLVKVKWLKKKLNGTLMVNNKNGAAESLQKISDELDNLPKEFLKYLINPAGTFLWRNIAGTKSLSAHSFAIAIDINVAQSHYWRQFKKDKDGLLKYRNNIPVEIVLIFEKHGWIWGGRWYHFDTMHFEYRPEIIAAVKAKTKKG